MPSFLLFASCESPTGERNGSGVLCITYNTQWSTKPTSLGLYAEIYARKKRGIRNWLITY